MVAKIIRFSEAVNSSESTAENKCKTVLDSLNDPVEWMVMAGLSSSSSSLHQSDDLDLVLIGARGIFLVEVKHWNASWINSNLTRAEAEAEKLTAKTRRFATRVKAILRESPKVTQLMLLTREPFVNNLPSHLRGVQLYSLRDFNNFFKNFPANVLTDYQVKLLVRTLEPNSKIQVDGKIRRIAAYQNLELQQSDETGFHRIYKGIHQRTKDRVILHLYDLSASKDKNPEKHAEREARTLQMLQKTRFVPRVRDTLQDLPEYPGELRYFTLIDPMAPTLAKRKSDSAWMFKERMQFAINCCTALQEIHGLNDLDAVPVIHRDICTETILVGPKNEPVFIKFNLSRISNTQTLGSSMPYFSEFAAPEVQRGGLAEASKHSDIFSLCRSLMTLFDENENEDSAFVQKVLQKGCHESPQTRCSLEELLNDLKGKIDVEKTLESSKNDLPPCEYWSEGQILPFGDKTLHLVSCLGSGGVGYTFKVEHIDSKTGENFGTYVAKVIKSKESGQASLDAYQRIRGYSTAPGLSVVFEVSSTWKENQIVALLKWIDGDSLDSISGTLPLIAEAENKGVEELLVSWVLEISKSLSIIHENGLVHGDVSPRNIIYHNGGLTLTDYDLVTRINQKSWGVGATSYCSPEAQRREPLTPSDDFYALAASLFEVMFDHSPFPSPHGALSKSGGLDWKNGERELLPKLAHFLDRATSADKNNRFSNAKEVIDALSSMLLPTEYSLDSTIEPSKISDKNIIQKSRQRVDWLDSLLRIYPGSLHGNVETRGLDSDFAMATYVETPLENELFESLIKREVRLLVLCGNAGDGKTALLQHLATKFGIERHQSMSRIWKATTNDGLSLCANLDGAASWQGKSANELLNEFFEPFHQGIPSGDIAHLLAINDGRLYDWLQNYERDKGVTDLTKALRCFLSQDKDIQMECSHIQFINLNHRSLVGGITPSGEESDDFIERLINLLLGGDKSNQIWSPCKKCLAWERCTAGPNAHKLLATKESEEGKLGGQMRIRLKEAFQAVHQRGQIHITARELRGVLSYVLFGAKSCDELHDNPSPQDAPLPYWDMLFSPRSPFRQGELLRELASLDPALEAHAKIDPWIIGQNAREISGAGPSYPGLSLDSARRRAYMEWSEDQIEALTGSKTDLLLANGEHILQFKQASRSNHLENADLCVKICRGISMLESLPTIALDRNGTVPLRITPRTPTETVFWVEKSQESFRLEAEVPKIRSLKIPILPRSLKLIYQAQNGDEDILFMGYELFHALLSLASGEQLSDLRSDDLFANLSIFTQRLAKEDDSPLFAWNPKSDNKLYHLSIKQSNARQILACEQVNTAPYE